MESLFERLLRVMNEEKVIHEELLELSKNKKEAIIANDVDTIDKIVAAEHILVAKSGQYDKQRQACVSQISRQAGIPVAEVSLQHFIDAAPENLKGELESLQVQMRKQLVELQALNDTNRRLIEARLDYIHFVVDSATNVGGSQVYSSRGVDSAQKKQTPRLYDQKV